MQYIFKTHKKFFIEGIPTNLQEEVVRKAVIRACNSEGGLFKDELYLPTQLIQIPVESAPTSNVDPGKGTCRLNWFWKKKIKYCINV